MRNFNKRRLLPVVLGMLTLILSSTVAYAYWTANGSGTGAGTAAASTSNVTVVQTTVLTAMYPGDTAQTISGNFNNANTGPVYISTVTASISSVTKGGVLAVGCDSSDFTLAGNVMTVNASIPVGVGGAWTGATIQFNNKATNQDACKGVTVNLGYAIP